MLEHDLDPTIVARAAKSDVDWRNAWAGTGPSGELLGWPAAAALAVGATAIEPLAILETTSPLEPMRERPAHGAAMVSEVREGERLRGLHRRDGWWLVAGEDDYTGWVHEWVLRDGAQDLGPCAFRYGLPLGTLWVSDHQAAAPLVLGTPLWPVEGPLPERGGFHLLRSPGGREGWVPHDQLRQPSAARGGREALNLVRALIGTPYRWGGRSPLGFDCSGLVQFVAQLCGADLPRDAIQQVACGEPVPADPGEWEAADLVFFGDPVDHVGFVDGRGRILHCQGRVRQERIDERGDLFARLVAVRRWLPLQAGSSGRAWTAPVQ